MRWVRDIAARLPDDADVLELGCGRGVPATRELAKRHNVTGVDVSRAQLELARHHVPEALYVHADMCRIEYDDSSFDGVVALYSLGHLPPDDQRGMLRRVARWLRPGGLFLVTVSARDDVEERVEDDWLGAPMYMAHIPAEETRTILRDSGLELVRDLVEPQVEHGQEVSFLWLLAARP